MINEISHIYDQQGQVHKPGNRHKDVQSSGMHTDKSGEFDTSDVVEISQLKPVQPVTQDKNEISFSSDAKNAEKNIAVQGALEGTDETSRGKEASQNDTSSVYGKQKSEIGKFLDTVA